MRVLDIGCGTGAIGIALGKMFEDDSDSDDDGDGGGVSLEIIGIDPEKNRRGNLNRQRSERPESHGKLLSLPSLALLRQGIHQRRWRRGGGAI